LIPVANASTGDGSVTTSCIQSLKGHLDPPISSSILIPDANASKGDAYMTDYSL